MKTQNYFILTLAAATLLAVGCSKIGVSDNSALVSAAVFGGTTGDNSPGGGQDGSGGGGMDGSGSNNPSGTSLVCSREGGAQVGYTLDNAAALEIQIVDSSGNVICKDDSAGIKDSIVNQKVFPLKICAAATGTSYKLRLVDPTQSSSSAKYDLLNFRNFSAKLTTDKSGSLQVMPMKVSVLYDNRANGDLKSCDQLASPLIIKTVSELQADFSLTSIAKGILFDILGDRAGHAKKQISWIKKSSYMFLVLPDEHGEVNGIDQMFGNNTLGPDGDYAENGYLALAKYDSNNDGVIDEKDPIYSKLRLWSDVNFDGVQESHELLTLQQAGIVSIELKADNSYFERDQYGNETRMKSIVHMADGSARLIFDLWFAYQDPK